MPHNPLPEIQTRLQHEYIRERKKGLGQAAGLLAQSMYRAPRRAESLPYHWSRLSDFL